MKKVLIIALLVLSCIPAFAENKKMKYEDYANKVNGYIDEYNAKLESIYANYNEKVNNTNITIKKLENDKEKTWDKLDKCWLAEQNSDLKQLLKGPCGHLYGKNTYFKSNSGLVFADETYAINKCLAKLPQDKKPYVSPCKKYQDLHEKLKKDIDFHNKQFEVFKQERNNEVEKAKQELKLQSDNIAKDCRKEYPIKRFAGYCLGLTVINNQ